MVAGKKYAGPSYSVPETIKNISKYADVIWINLRNQFIFNQDDFQNVKYYNLGHLNEIGFNNSLEKLTERIDIAVFEDLYYFPFVKISRILKTKNIPYVVVPRGSLCAEAQRKKRIKKYLANLFFFNSFLKRASKIHFLTNMEAMSSGEKWNNKYFVIPNGVVIPEIDIKKYDNNKEKKIKGVFIGRIDIFHKGLDILMRAVSRNKELIIRNNVDIEIYGPVLNNDSYLLSKMIKDLGLEEIVKINDAVYDVEKSQVLKESDFFILTSRFEGHPTGLLEALAYGLPALVTYGSNFGEEIEQNRAGWTSETNPESLTKTLEQMLNELEYLDDYRVNARNLAERYDWASISKRIYDELSIIVNGD